MKYTLASKDKNADITFYLVDFTGRKVLSKDISGIENEVILNLPELSSGLYLAILDIAGSRPISQNIIIEK